MPGNPGSINQANVDLFKAKAKPASIEVVVVKDLKAALDYAIEVTEKTELGKLMPTTPGLSPPDDPNRKKTLAAPSISDEHFKLLSQKGEAKGFEMVRSKLRNHLAGIDVAFTVADLGISETATCVSENNSEDYRLATMICETHVLALPMNKLVKTSYEAEDFLIKAMDKDNNYTSFISGPSRTADIERVLTLGVHGPLYMHVALLEE
ncbi:MAG: lactate utilization protein [Deltaproteobacteria bacterium]|jgi:L-lactate dehydrogenase complex protein LldG|nr:lactate utilization protein [Deltaproteobacteria bacterium]